MIRHYDAYVSQFNLPNALSLSRAISAPLAFWLIINNLWIWASVLLMVAIVTDVSDGKIARARQQTSALGGFLDHGSDALLVTSMLAAEAVLGLITPILPVLVIAAFAQYSWDSAALKGQPLRASQLGRYNGILYFVLAGFPILQPTLNTVVLNHQAIYWFSVVLTISTILSMANRAYVFYRMTRS